MQKCVLFYPGFGGSVLLWPGSWVGGWGAEPSGPSLLPHRSPAKPCTSSIQLFIEAS